LRIGEWIAAGAVALVALVAIVKSAASKRNGAAGRDYREAPGYGGRHYDRGGLTKRHWRSTLDLEKGITGRNARTVRQFVQNLTISGVWHHLQGYGFNPIGPAAVMLHETGFGLSYAAREYDNLLGVSYTDRTGDKPRDRPYKFDSVPHCLEFFDTMMNWSRYAGALAKRSRPAAFVEALGAAGYNSTDSWRRDVLRYVDQLNDYIGK
jgi:hypothetical protein